MTGLSIAAPFYRSSCKEIQAHSGSQILTFALLLNASIGNIDDSKEAWEDSLRQQQADAATLAARAQAVKAAAAVIQATQPPAQINV
jgi:hypothetical protein